MSEYVRSPRSNINDKASLNEKNNFNNTVNLKLKGLLGKEKGNNQEI